MAHVAIMIRIIPSENRNMYFRMIQDSDTTFKVEMGRVGAAPYIRYYPISVWDKMYQKKISEGYQDKTELMDVHSSYTYKEIEDDSVRELISFLQQESSMAIKSNYSVSVSEVSPQMITQAEDILNQFTDNPRKDNSLLEQLFALLPRKMKNVADYLLPADAEPEKKKGIGPCDEVYILGDVGMYHEKEIGKFLMALPGKKYLVTGNHDFKNIHNRDFSSAFLWCRPYAEVRDNERKVVLFHYPIEEWNGFYVGSYHLHGHIHNTTVTHIDRRYNVSVDVINYTPVTLDELIAQNDVK